jgi:Protein of unknown function (DUF2924)
VRAGALLAREWKRKLERVMVLEKGFVWNGETYVSLSQIAKAITGTSWNGHRFFGLRTAKSNRSAMPGRKGGVRDGAPLAIAPFESTQNGKVCRSAGSLNVTGAANGEMALVRTTGHPESTKAVSP